MGDLPFGSKRFGDKRRKPVAIMSLQPPLKRCRKANGETSETAMDADDDHGETSETKIYHVTLRAGSIIHFVTPDPVLEQLPVTKAAAGGNAYVLEHLDLKDGVHLGAAREPASASDGAQQCCSRTRSEPKSTQAEAPSEGTTASTSRAGRVAEGCPDRGRGPPV